MGTPPIVLAVESSGRSAGVAVARGDELLLERRLPPGPGGRAQSVLPLLAEVLRETSLASRDVGVVAVGTGPGSFTGLRIGVVAAKTFAYATGASLIACDTFEVIAANLPETVVETYVVEDAQRGDLFVGLCRRDATGSWKRIGEITIEPRDEWCRDRAGTDHVTGPGLRRCAERLEGRCRIASEEAWEPRAAVVARAGWRRFREGTRDDPFGLEPLYLRRSSAEDRWERARGG